MRHITRLKLLCALLLFAPFCFAADVDQLANSTREYNWLWVTDTGPRGQFVMAWADSCSTTGFTPTARSYEPSPGQPSRTAEIFSFPGCRFAPNFAGRYGILRSRLRSDSIRDLGVYTIRCENTAITTINCTPLPEPTLCGYRELCLPVLFDNKGPQETTVEIFNNPPNLDVSHSGTHLTPAGDATYNSRLSLFAEATDTDPGEPDVSWQIKRAPPSATARLIGSLSHAPEVQFSNERDFGTWVFEAIADDAQGERVRRELTINVVNQTPEPEISGTDRVAFGDDMVLMVSPDEDGGDYSNIRWEALSPGGSTWAVVGHDATLRLSTDIGAIGAWTFRVTVTDNESPPLTGTSDDFIVEVYNQPPEISISDVPSPFVRVSEASHFIVDATDPDGGDVAIEVRIFQLPETSTAVVGSTIRRGTNHLVFSRVNSESDAGTWIFEVTATDDEPEPVQGTDSEEVVILVDADPVPHITQVGGATPIGSLTDRLVLTSEDTVDPDSPCEGEPMRCHETSDGDPPREISAAILGRNWQVIEGALDDGTFHATGPVHELFDDVANGGVELSIPPATLPSGLWTFQLNAQDGEGNEAFATHIVEVINENTAPLVFLDPPQRYIIPPINISDRPIGFDGTFSFDPDNILTGDLPGIDAYHWDVLASGVGCAVIPASRDEPTYELFPSGRFVDPACQGIWQVELTVDDTDMPQKSNSATATLSIGTCAGTVCIDHPTQGLPYRADFAEDTDVFIFYHIDPVVTSDARFQYGMVARLDIYHHSDLSTPVFTSFNPNVYTTAVSPLLVFHWNGYWFARRPQSGKYSVKVSLLDYALNPTGLLFEDFERDAIHLEVDELSVSEDSDRYINRDHLKDHDDTLSIGYDIEGMITPERVEWRLVNEAGTPVYRANLSRAFSGTIEWDGRDDHGDLIDVGHYEIQIEAFIRDASLTGIARHPVTIYTMRLQTATASSDLVVMVNSDDDNRNGVPDMSEGMDVVSNENDLLEVHFSLQPAIDGHLEIRTSDSPPKVQLYGNANRGGGSTAMPLNYDFPADAVPPIFIEATDAGEADIRMRLTPTDHVTLADSVQKIRNVRITLENATRDPMPFANIALWGDAYRDVRPYTILDQPGNLLVDREQRRFYVRVEDPIENERDSHAEFFDVELSVVDDAGINDEPTRIRVSEQNARGDDVRDSGSFASESQLLTTQDLPHNADDKYRAVSRWGGRPADETPNDRTHKTTIDQDIVVTRRVEGITLSHTTPVCQREPESRRRVQVRARIFRNPSTGDPYADPAYVEDHIEKANLAWSPACIRFELLETTIHDAPTVAPSGGGSAVNILADGMFQSKNPGSMRTCRHPDCQAVLSAYAAGASEDVFELFIVPNIPGANGFAVIPRVSVPGAGLKVFIFMRHDLPTDIYRTFAHEMGHALTNTFDSHQPPSIFYPQRPWRTSDGSPHYPITPSDQRIQFYRRVLQGTIDQARKDRLLEHCDGGASGLIICGDWRYPAPSPNVTGNYALKPW